MLLGTGEVACAHVVHIDSPVIRRACNNAESSPRWLDEGPNKPVDGAISAFAHVQFRADTSPETLFFRHVIRISQDVLMHGKYSGDRSAGRPQN